MSEYLDGWKAIAGELGVSVRTAHYWRARMGLPVVSFSPRRVLASKAELRSWFAQRCTSLHDVPAVARGTE